MPALDEPLSTQTNAKVTPSTSSWQDASMNAGVTDRPLRKFS